MAKQPKLPLPLPHTVKQPQKPKRVSAPTPKTKKLAIMKKEKVEKRFSPKIKNGRK